MSAAAAAKAEIAASPTVLPATPEVSLSAKPQASKQKSRSATSGGGGDHQAIALYSVADGKIMQHSVQFGGAATSVQCQTLNFYGELNNRLAYHALDPTLTSGGAQQKPFGASGALEYGLTEFAVLRVKTSGKRSDDCFFMVGKFDGCVELFSKRSNECNEEIFTKLCTFYNHQKLVTCIKWSCSVAPEHAVKTIPQQKEELPESKRMDIEDEMCLVASGSNDMNVIVIDFRAMIGEIEAKRDAHGARDGADGSQPFELKYFAKFKHKLSGHKERITCLSWSRRGGALLVSASYDGTVQVYCFIALFLRRDTNSTLASYIFGN